MRQLLISFSCFINHCLRIKPPPYPPRSPFVLMTRWQGTIIPSWLAPLAWAIARKLLACQPHERFQNRIASLPEEFLTALSKSPSAMGCQETNRVFRILLTFRSK